MKRKTKRKSNLINKTGFTPGFDTENNFINYIPSEDITMRNTPYPLNATPLDQYGNPIGQTVTMQPGQDYRFGGASYVAETRMFKDGGKQEWISNKIGELVREGRPQKQAIAIAYSMYNQKHELGGRQLPMFQVGVGGFTDPANPDLGENAFGQTAVKALPASVANNSQYSINQATQNLPTGWSVTGYGSQAVGATPVMADPNTQTAADKKLYTDAQKTPQTGISISDEELNNPTNQGNIPSSEMQQRMSFNKSVNTAADNYDSEGNAIDTDLANQAREDFESGARRYQFANPYGGYGIGESLTGAGLAAGEGRTGEAALFGANALLQGTKSFLSGMGAGKRKASITGSMYENELDYMKGRPQYGEDGGEIEDDTEMEDMDDMDDLPMKQRIAMLAQSYQMPELNLPQYETQQQEEMRKGGYYKFGGKSYPMYQTGDMFEEENSDLINKYPNQAMQRQEVQQRFVPQPAIYPQPEPITTNTPQLTQTAKEQPKEVWQIWQEVTGKPWSAAKKEGFTDGSAKANMALADKLLKGEKLGPAKKVQAPVKKQMDDNRTYYGGQLKEVVVMAPKKKVAPGRFMLTSDKAYQDYVKSNRMRVPNTPPNPNLLVQINPMDFSPRKQTPMFRQAYQGGGVNGVEDSDAANYENRANMQLANYENDLGNSYNNMYNSQVANYQSGLLNLPPRQTTPTLEDRLKINTRMEMLNKPAYYQEGGMQPEMEAPQEGMPEQGMPQQGGGDPMQEMMAQVVSMLQQGASPQEVLQQLVQAGIPQEQAVQIIQAAMQQAQGGQQATPQLRKGGQMIRRADGSYSQRGLWDNIRDNAGSNKKPTKEMLDQEEKIRANEKEMGGYMYAEGGINNPGFRALPKNVQDKIISNMYQEGGQEMPAEQPQDQGNQMGQVVAQIAEALQQGANPEEVLQQLIQMGVPEQEATQMIQMVMQQMQQAQGAQQAPPQEEMQQQTMKMGGKYLNMLRGKTIKSYTYNPKTDSYDIKYK